MTDRFTSPFEVSIERRELHRLIRRIQVLAAEVDELRRAGSGPELEEKERALERLRWRLASVARRSAADDLGNAA